MWQDDFKIDRRDAFSGTSMAARCYESHPPLKIGKGLLYGGSASHPVVKDADVYVSLQSGSTSGRQTDPWEKQQKVVEVYYAISDMHAPTDAPRFKKLVTWVCNQLHEGKKVHVGCIGGHGRTGLLISAIVAEATEKKDVIQWVRKHYCKKAVESKTQVQFLMKHYEVTEVEPAKGETKVWSGNGGSTVSSWMAPLQPGLLKAKHVEGETKGKVKKLLPEGVSSKTKSYVPMASTRSLWKPRKQKI